MTFNSLTFLVFFSIVLGAHHLPLSWKARKRNLCAASYVFYAAWNPPFVILLWISTLVDWTAGRRIAAADRLGRKRAWLVLSLCANLGLLGYFKYGGFLLENTVELLALIHIRFLPAAPDIVLPVGISFYTFQSLSYSLDIYRGRMRPWDSAADFALFVTFFPQLVAGPIVRAADFLPQCREPRRATGPQLGWGLTLVCIGLFEKIVLSDAFLAPVADRVYAAPEALGCVDAWIGTLAFSGQIFFDFAGYSTCAIGSALCLGFILPDNFRSPYGAVGFSDFWRRWHVSLSTWLRDYLYISLGGNRKGRLRTGVNLMVTMLLGGLWHGASWHFVIWGGLHGLYLMVERGLKNIRFAMSVRRFLNTAAMQGVFSLLTFAVVTVTWVLFRAADLSSAGMILTAMTGGDGVRLVSRADIVGVAVLTAGLVLGHRAMRQKSLNEVCEKVAWGARAVLLAGMLITLALAPGEERAFIYFQF